ncbi:piggyBac transposable element-derived protein 4-like [Procambarus clarkii]|uniref:piggyBac transposable element-derived protein 4-like n=1 Tax=Procambarus clarkii TaxID=6728 RepID=UPI003742E995
MSRDRFLLIPRCLHFENNANEDRHDRLWKVRKVFSDLRGKFRDYFVPGQNVVIDESLVLFKGRLAFKQYIPSKRHCFGLKFFVLCDCETDIVLDMILYSSTDVDIPVQDEHGFSGSVVKSLMEPWLNKRHILFTDNYYTSPLLTKYLLAHNTGVCGTVKLIRKEMPIFGIGIGVGECQLRKCDNMLSVQWKDRHEVNMLTTIHTGAMLDTGKDNFQTHNPMYKPDCVIDYNMNMRLVDKCDMMLGGVECVHRSVKWTKKFLFHLMDVAVLNCYNTYLVKSGRKPSIRTFSASVVSQLLVKYGKEGSVVPCGVQATMPHAAPDRLRGNENFGVQMLEYMPGTASREKGKRACIVCRNTTRRPQKRRCISTWCVECKVPLCPVGCFAAYHTFAEY